MAVQGQPAEGFEPQLSDASVPTNDERQLWLADQPLRFYVRVVVDDP